MSRRRLRMVRAAVGLLSLIRLCAPQGLALGADAKRVASIEGITEYSLDNGLKVLLFPDPSKPTVTVSMTIFVGSRHEGYGESGMAHLLEHMLFKGTPDHPDIPGALKEHGAGSRFNGTTWVDRTNYYETMPANDRNLEFGIGLEADRLVSSYVRGADLKSEMTVVRNEFESGENQPEGILMQRMLASAYEWHNYGKNTIGNRADIERVPIENLREFYVRYYQPDNAMVVVAGRFDPKKALALITKYFGAIPRPERKLNSTYTEEPAQDGERVTRLRRVGDVAVVGLTYHIPAGGQEGFPAVEVLEGILSDDPSGRLYKSLVETKKASAIYGMTFSWHDPGVMILMAPVVQGQSADDILKSMLATIDDVAKKGVTREETERIKQQLLKQREMASADSSRIAVQLSEWAAQGDWRLYFVHRDRIEKVTKEDVSKAAAKYLKADNRTVGIFQPTKSPDRISIPMIADLSKSIGNYKGRDDIAMGEEFDVTPGHIDQRTVTPALESGLKAAFLEKKTRGHAVHVRLRLRYGDLKSLEGMTRAAQFLPELMLRGTKELSHQQIQDEFDRLRARVIVEGTPGEMTFSILTRRESLPAFLKLLGKILREPSLPENELEILKRSELADLEKALSDPQELAVNAVRRHTAPYSKGDPRYVPTIEESMSLTKRLTVSDLRKLYNDYLNGRHGELSIVGDFESAKVIPLLNSILAGWKASVPYAYVSRDLKVDVSGGSQQITTPDKANANYFAALVFAMREDDPDYPALSLGNFVLGGNSLSSRLGDRVRQKEGLSYGIGSSLQSSSKDRRTAMTVYAICNPANIDKVRKAIAEELQRLLSKGIDAKELAAAKRGLLQGEQLRRTEDGNLAAVLGNNLWIGRTMAFQASLEKRIGELTSDEIVDAMRRRIDPKRLFIVTAGDFAKKESAANSR